MTRDSEARLLAIAARQYSVFSRRQALEAGLSSRGVEWRIGRGLWIPLHRGVYIPAGLVVGWQQRAMAACLACGERAVASHGSAAAIWSFTDDVAIPHVTVPADGLRTHPGVVVHRARKIDSVRNQRFLVTSPMRTLVDLASDTAELTLEQWLDNAHRRRLIDLARLGRYLDLAMNRRRAGCGALRRMVAVRNPDRPIGSELATTLFHALQSAGLPMPTIEHPVRTRQRNRFIDFAHPHALVAIEVDGFETHGTYRAFDADRLRGNELEVMGWHVLRFTWAQLTSDPAGVAVTVGLALGLVPTRWRRTGAKASRKN